ncbi:MAG: ankyrin repeat domain-containing protein [Alphaproteobacteria bacterium]|nr:ankyrin repeat domain-containing protein [Alphaproteobacteria bacterium]
MLKMLYASQDGLNHDLAAMIGALRKGFGILTRRRLAQLVNRQTDRGIFPLLGAAAMGQVDCVRMLLDHGADPSLIFEPAGATSLVMLLIGKIRLKFEHYQIIRLLADRDDSYQNNSQIPEVKKQFVKMLITVAEHSLEKFIETYESSQVMVNEQVGSLSEDLWRNFRIHLLQNGLELAATKYASKTKAKIAEKTQVPLAQLSLTQLRAIDLNHSGLTYGFCILTIADESYDVGFFDVPDRGLEFVSRDFPLNDLALSLVNQQRPLELDNPNRACLWAMLFLLQQGLYPLPEDWSLGEVEAKSAPKL